MNTADISAAVRTVTDIDAHFEELKQRVVEVAERVDAQSRGFFTPAEEEQTLGLLVSYWQSRAALLELITDFRSDDELSEADRPSAFLAAFAGALLLVDAARFLREKIHEKRVIRKKLNQEAPEFGIPARVYAPEHIPPLGWGENADRDRPAVLVLHGQALSFLHAR